MSARTPASATCTTCRASTTRRCANTSASWRSSAPSDHALRDRTLLELNVKIGAAYLRQGRAEDAERHFGRALKSFDSRVASGADDPFTRYYIACLYALRGDATAALESLERVAATSRRSPPPARASTSISSRCAAYPRFHAH